MPHLTCRACGHPNETSARHCQNCGAPEEELRAGADLGPWWPLAGIVAGLAVLYGIARALNRQAALGWLALAALVCLAVGGLALAHGGLRFRGRGPTGTTARWQSAGLLVAGIAALAILIERLLRGV